LSAAFPSRPYELWKSIADWRSLCWRRSFGIPERTLARRKTAGKLAPDESERLLRIANLFEKCVELFEGDVTAAVNWLTSPKKALNQERPLMYARTEFGAREVEDLIGRLEHGVFS
jgi:putative toxin-antitoxin system antitoxin component (TIGR02293 family)